MRLILMRHGQTPANVLGELSTAAPGPGLTDLGLRQARAVPGSLAGEPIEAVYASVLVRTQLTGAPLADARGLGVHVLPGLHEIEAGELENRADRDAVRTYLDTVMAWSGDLSARIPGGPDGHEFFGRFEADLATIAERHDPDATVVAVSHGAAIRVWAGGRSRNLTPDFTSEHHLDNTGLVVVEGDPAAGWVVQSWQGLPVGGLALVDQAADDVTGEPVEEAVADAD